MLTKAQFLESVGHEVRIIKHLATKVPKGQYDYRPTPSQRSTLELLRYLSHAALSGGTFAVTGSWDHYDAFEAEAEKLQPGEFAARMDRQLAEIGKLLAPFTDADLGSRPSKTMMETTIPLGANLTGMVLKLLVAYRMQLFLYAKASGASTIGSMDCWAGVDQQAAAGG
jgi:hypothetical protein